MAKQSWKPGNMVYPLPAVMVSCQCPGEKPNIITVAWCGTICSDPAMVSISVRPDRYSYGILKRSGEFVINLTSRDLTFAADFCGVRSGRDLDKFEEMHLTPQPSETIEAPGIAESPVNIECRVTQTIPLGSHTMFLAEVLAVRVDESLLDDKGGLKLEKADLSVYSHGSYFALGEALGTFGYSVKKPVKTKAAVRNKPAAGRNKPAASGNKPAAGRNKPAASGDKSAAGRSKPAASGDKSAAGRNKPAASGSRPAGGRAKSKVSADMNTNHRGKRRDNKSKK